MDLFKKVFLHSPIKYIVLLIIGILITIINCISKGFDLLVSYVDGAFVAGATIFLIGGLSTLNYFGAYDFWSYTFSKRAPNGTKKPLYEYSNEKQEKRSRAKIPFGAYYAVGVFYIICSIILYMFL